MGLMNLLRRIGLLLPLPLLLIACAPQLSGQAVSPLGAGILYRDDFSPAQTGPWLTEADAQGYTAVADGRLLIDLNAPNLIQFVTLREPQFDDFILEIEATQLDGALDSSHGVLFRMQGTEAFYRFAITGTGFFIFERRDADGSWHRLTPDWMETSAIRQGLNAANHLRVDAVGSQISLYINGELVQRVVDNRYSQGTIAVEAGTFGPGQTRVAFDNLVVRQP
jgi:hypothetical protein